MRPKRLHRRASGVVDLARVAHVARRRPAPGAPRAHRRGDGARAPRPAAADHDVAPTRASSMAIAAADTLAGAGHDRDAIVKRIGREAHRRGY